MNNVPLNNDEKDLQINAIIQQMAQQHQPELPSPGVIWWRAQIQKKFAEKERIERPMAIMRLLAGTVGLVIAAYLILNYRVQLAGSTAFSGILFPLCLLALGSLIMFLLAGLRESRS